jgi:hypothetical protein
MKKIVLAAACMLFAAMAFAQTEAKGLFLINRHNNPRTGKSHRICESVL